MQEALREKAAREAQSKQVVELQDQLDEALSQLNAVAGAGDMVSMGEVGRKLEGVEGGRTDGGNGWEE